MGIVRAQISTRYGRLGSHRPLVPTERSAAGLAPQSGGGGGPEFSAVFNAGLLHNGCASCFDVEETL